MPEPIKPGVANPTATPAATIPKTDKHAKLKESFKQYPVLKEAWFDNKTGYHFSKEAATTACKLAGTDEKDLEHIESEFYKEPAKKAKKSK